jgi:uncharacterized membrane protein YkoI
MHSLRLMAFAAFLLGLAQPAFADGAMSCLSKEQRQAVIASGQVIPLTTAMATLSGRSREVVRVRLCQGPKGYVYLLTLLARDGKVTRVTVDAKNGLVLSR